MWGTGALWARPSLPTALTTKAQQQHPDLSGFPPASHKPLHDSLSCPIQRRFWGSQANSHIQGRVARIQGRAI